MAASFRFGKWVPAISVIVALCGLSGCGGCGKNGGQDGSMGDNNQRGTGSLSTADYNKVVGLFYSANVAMETGGTEQSFLEKAENRYNEAAKLAPQEPAIWANLAVLHLTGMPKMPQAKTELDKALSLTQNDKDKSVMEVLAGKYELAALKPDFALDHFRKAIALDASNVNARYLLADTLKQIKPLESVKEQVEQFKEIVKLLPDNFLVALEGATAAAKAGDGAAANQFLTQFKALKFPVITPAQQQRFAAIEKAAAANDLKALSAQIPPMQYVLREVKTSLRNSNELTGRDRPMDRFFVLKTPSATPAAPDTAMEWQQSAVGDSKVKWQLAFQAILGPELPDVWYKEGLFNENPTMKPAPEQSPFFIQANSASIMVFPSASASGGSAEKPSATLAFPGKAGDTLTPDSVIVADVDYDFRPDIIAAGSTGLKIYSQKPQFGTFEDSTAKTKLPPAILNGRYRGVMAYDFDFEGDLDLVVAPEKGEPFLLQNNGDGTYQVVKRFAGVSDVRGMAWADVDNHGDADIVFVAGNHTLVVFENARTGVFKLWKSPANVAAVTAITTADTDRDGTMEIIAASKDGSLHRINRNENNTDWEVTSIGKVESILGTPTHLVTADLDNNGATDLIVSGKSASQVLLGNEKSEFVSHSDLPDAINLLPALRANETGRLALHGVTSHGAINHIESKGTKAYHWLEVRPRARYVNRVGGGDRRINSFGIGGTMELRAALLYQKLPLTAPTLHFGMGDNDTGTVIRIVWPNGFVRSELPSPDPLAPTPAGGQAGTHRQATGSDITNNSLKADQMILAPYRLGGSCPWLFAWDGTKMAFITDCIWRSPLGLKINAGATAGVTQTEDWIKLRGDQLAPRDGFYDLSICAELWETHFFDHLALMEVDHPQGTDIYVDERFIPNAQPKLKIHVTTPARPVAKAWGTNGEDVTAIVNAKDGKHLDDFARGEFQGVARDHWVELDIPADSPKDKPLFLIANGWIHPTDSGINVALSQGKHEPPRGLSIEVPDGKGNWKTALPGLGFPEGKIKTVVIEIGALFKSTGNAPRRIRLRTNLEIYWDFIGTASGLPDNLMHITRVPLHDAILRHRGFSTPIQGERSTPEVAEYDNLTSTAQTWLDLEGYYTRFGDVLPLLAKTDDRYVIMNAGDEMKLRFAATPKSSSSMVRDYALVGDGWVKDGNFNTQFSRTVLPLPYHGKQDYTVPPTTLEADPVYRKHAADWQTYHTRYVSTSRFFDALRPDLPQRGRQEEEKKGRTIAKATKTK